MDELRDEFNDAWDKAEAAAPEIEPIEEPTPIAEEGVKDEKIGDESAAKEEIADPEEKPEDKPKEESKAEPEKGAQKPKEAAAKEPEKSKAPASWGAKARQKWGDVPAEAQAQIAKREKEINQVLQQSAVARKAADQLNAILAPHKDGMIAAGHQDPFQAISGLLQTESTLRIGSQQQKAQELAAIIKNYGVDIATLDAVLTGEAPPDPQTAGLEAMLDKRMAPINDFLKMQQQNQQYQHQNEEAGAAQAVQEFEANAEFLSDVRMDMADLMDGASRRGQKMTLQQAYDKACAIHPEVSGVLAERAKQAQIMGTKEDLQAKKAASISLVGKQEGAGGGAGNLSMRDQIESAWNSA